eukprot:1412993-Rhodomonas_salina.1
MQCNAQLCQSPRRAERSSIRQRVLTISFVGILCQPRRQRRGGEATGEAVGCEGEKCPRMCRVGMKAEKREKKENGDVRAWSHAMLLLHSATATPFQVVARHRAWPELLLFQSEYIPATRSQGRQEFTVQAWRFSRSRWALGPQL